MDDDRTLLLRFLLKKLRETKHELNVHRAVFMNFSDEVQAEVLRLQKFYREAEPIRRNTEREFQPFDELIEQFPQDSERLLALLAKWNPEGDPN